MTPGQYRGYVAYHRLIEHSLREAQAEVKTGAKNLKYQESMAYKRGYGAGLMVAWCSLALVDSGDAPINQESIRRILAGNFDLRE